MNQDPSQLPSNPNIHQAFSAAELEVQQTPADMIGVLDGQFDVQRGQGENTYTEKGWNVVKVGMDTDKETGEQRQFVEITNAQLGVDGKPQRDESGDVDGETKSVWTDKFKSWQKSEADESTEVVEAEQALENIGAAAVNSEVEVDMITIDTSLDATEQQDITQTAEFKQRAAGDLGTLYAELNRFGNMPDSAVNSSIRNLVDYAQRQQVDIQRTFEGASVGALRDPRFAHDYYADNVRPSLQAIIGNDTAALRRIDDVVNAHVETMRKATNQDPNYAKQLKGQLVSSMIEQSRGIGKMISKDNPQAIRQSVLFLQGLAVGLSDNMIRGDVMQIVRKTLLKS